ESLGHHSNGTNPRPKGGTEGHGMSSVPQPVYLVSRRERLTPVSTLEENRAVADATDVVRTCEGCQFYARKTHLPAHILQTIPITWPFAVWGLDLVGPL